MVETSFPFTCGRSPLQRAMCVGHNSYKKYPPHQLSFDAPESRRGRRLCPTLGSRRGGKGRKGVLARLSRDRLVPQRKMQAPVYLAYWRRKGSLSVQFASIITFFSIMWIPHYLRLFFPWPIHSCQLSVTEVITQRRWRWLLDQRRQYKMVYVTNLDSTLTSKSLVCWPGIQLFCY
jgi:hypothetical protein